MKMRWLWAGLAVVVLASAAPAQQAAGEMPSPDSIRQVMERSFSYMRDNRIIPPNYDMTARVAPNQMRNSWISAAFMIGVMEAYKATGNEAYHAFLMEECEKMGWMVGKRRLADDHAIGQVYADLYAIHREPRMIQDLVARYELMMTHPMPGRREWYWCDAAFMDPPTLAHLYAANADVRLLDFLHVMFWDQNELLYDPVIRLYYRDIRYMPPHGPRMDRDAMGRPTHLFWSRGNGWVVSGIARVIDKLPVDDLQRQRYVELLREMCEKIAGLQQEDGLWRTSLLEPEAFPMPETSGTAFFCHAMAWGINRGVLNRNTYLPVVLRAWDGLVKAVNDEGRLTWVQTVAANPNVVRQEDTQEYAVGALLMAGAEMLKLAER